MKPVFKCDYCNFIGTEEQVRKHEDEDCYDNYTKRSCTTCVHKSIASLKQYKCNCGIEIPEGKMMTQCKKYERKEKNDTFSDLLGGLFGGL